MKMNPDVKVEWLTALRDGTREQGTQHLLADGKYCCLGVLCEVAANEGVVDSQPHDEVWNDDCSHVVVSFDGERTALPEDVQKWASLALYGNVSYYTADQSLAWRNDAGESFESIADWIEENL